MNIREELDKRVFGWLENWYIENNLDPGDPNNLEFIMNNKEEFIKREKENNLKYNITTIPEEDNEKYCISKDETILRLTIDNRDYLVACAERLYCKLGEYKWRWF